MAGFDPQLFHFWPLLRVVIETARVVGVHHRWLASTLQEEYPSVAIETIGMGAPEALGDKASARVRLGIPATSRVFAAFGRATPGKRIAAVLRALADVRTVVPDARLLLVGEQVDYYDVEADARATGVADHVVVTGHVADDMLADCLHAADVCLCLRWPTGRDVSASWLQCLAAGKPTIVTNFLHLSDLVTLDPRTWTSVEAQRSSLEPVADNPGPIAVAIDCLDEQHSLGLAMRRLATDARLRQELGTRARAHWERAHTLPLMAADYQRTIERAIAARAPDKVGLPAPLLRDGTSLARTLCDAMGVTVDVLG
jgi:glycosyltransferase involved in cell wall biosynthesis